MQWGNVMPIMSVNISPTINEELRCFFQSILASIVQWGPTVIVLLIDTSTSIDQQLDNGVVPFF